MKHDSLGLKPYVEFAVEAGVPDTAAFATCFLKKDKVPAIERDIAAAAKLRVSGTPSIIVNGMH